MLFVQAANVSAATPRFNFTESRLPWWKQACNGMLANVGLARPFSLGAAQKQLEDRGIVLGAEIANGYQGTIYEATAKDRAKQLHLAVKIAKPGSEAALAEEYEVLKVIRPGKVTLFRGDDGILAMVMELGTETPPRPGEPAVPAPTLWRMLFPRPGGHANTEFSNDTDREPKKIHQLAIDLIDDMAHVHSKGYVHRDIKPDNVLVINGRATLIDFGMTVKKGHEDTDGYTRGTPGFMNEEAATTGTKASFAQDVFAMQRTLEMLYFRDYFQRLGTADANNYFVREMFDEAGNNVGRWVEMQYTFEQNEEGVSPQIAWVLHSRVPTTAAELKELLLMAEKSTSMADFLKQYRVKWLARWDSLTILEKDDLIHELLKKPVYGKEFFEGLPAYARKRIRREAEAIADSKRGPVTRFAKPAFGSHPRMLTDWLLAIPPP